MRMSVTRLLIFYSQTPVAMKNLVILFLITFSFGAFACSPADSVYRKDQTLLKHFFEYANKKEIAKLPINEKVVAIGRYFLETPYVGGTLDINPQEKLVVNLREFDCVTFVDNVIALARLDKNKVFPNSKRIYKSFGTGTGRSLTTRHACITLPTGYTR